VELTRVIKHSKYKYIAVWSKPFQHLMHKTEYNLNYW